MKKSLLLRFLEWITPYLTPNVVGWIYASNAAICLAGAVFLDKMQEDGVVVSFMCGIFFLLIAILFWLPEEWK